MSARVDGDVVKIRWAIADGYYVYRNKIEVRAESPDLTVGQPNLPAGTRISDPYFGVQEIYEQQVEATVPFTRFDYGAHPLQVKVIYQGCAHAGLCYPPITKVLFPESGPATTPLAGAQRGAGHVVARGHRRGLRRIFSWRGVAAKRAPAADPRAVKRPLTLALCVGVALGSGWAGERFYRAWSRAGTHGTRDRRRRAERLVGRRAQCLVRRGTGCDPGC